MTDSPFVTSDDVRLMADIGFIAFSRGFHREAAAIFRGLMAARPSQEAGPIGLALVHLMRDEAAEAIAILKKQPPSDAVLTYLGLAQSRIGDIAAARRNLTEVAGTALDPSFSTLADGLLKALDAR